MTIYKSGDAVNLIEKFLQPLEKPKPSDASPYPDCAGTGMYYPEGPVRGVAYCRHERLVN